VAQSDKYLATGNNIPHGPRPYKARLFNQEPGLAPMELTIGIRETIAGQKRMNRQRKTIAVIDDDAGIRQALERMLRIAGFPVHTFASAEEFLAAITTCDAGCAVVDLELGEMSGFELACHPDVVAAKLPVIFISGTADETARASALALGCIEYLRKPFMPIELLDAVFRATQDSPIP
jgi:FixJ family two-component response regulator